MKHLLSAADLDRDSALSILDEAERLKETLLGREVRKLPTLRGKTVLTVFYENSTRTRVSFETAGKWMSADVINVSASASSVQKGESLRDTALTLTAIGADEYKSRTLMAGTLAKVEKLFQAEGIDFPNEFVVSIERLKAKAEAENAG